MGTLAVQRDVVIGSDPDAPIVGDEIFIQGATRVTLLVRAPAGATYIGQVARAGEDWAPLPTGYTLTTEAGDGESWTVANLTFMSGEAPMPHEFFRLSIAGASHNAGVTLTAYAMDTPISLGHAPVKVAGALHSTTTDLTLVEGADYTLNLTAGTITLLAAGQLTNFVTDGNLTGLQIGWYSGLSGDVDADAFVHVTDMVQGPPSKPGFGVVDPLDVDPDSAPDVPA